MKMIGLAVLGVILAGQARAETLAAPRIAQGDSWTYVATVENKTGWHQTRVETAVIHTGADSIALSSKPVGSTMPPSESMTGSDWSRIRNLSGKETLINRPLAFPLTIGKSWTVEYTEDNPNREHSSEHFKTIYKVVGWEDVTVPAGTFNAMKIEADGQWTAVLAPAVSNVSGARVDGHGATVVMQSNRTTAATVGGRTYKAFWYVPSVKKWAKSVEEYYNANDVRSARYTNELEAYKLAN